MESMEGMESSENYRNHMEIMCLIELMYKGFRIPI